MISVGCRIKLYKCTLISKITGDVCGVTGNRRQALIEHVLCIHTPKDFHPHTCPECNELFRLRRDMRHHIKTVHKREGRVECEYCNEILLKKNLNRHNGRCAVNVKFCVFLFNKIKFWLNMEPRLESQLEQQCCLKFRKKRWKTFQ